MLRNWPQKEMTPSTQFINDGPLTPDDLAAQITARFRYVSEAEVRARYVNLLNHLNFRHVNSVNRFKQVMSDTEAIKEAEDLYIEELHRPPYRIFDVDAVVIRPTQLHLANTPQSRLQVCAVVRAELRNCPEAAEHRNYFSRFPAVSLNEGRVTKTVSQPSIAIVNEEQVFEFEHFNKLKSWVPPGNSSRIRFLVFDFDKDTLKWVEVTAEGNKLA